MLTGTPGWLLCVVAITIVWIVLYVRRGPAESLAAAMVLSFLCPVWVKLTIAGIPLTVQTTIAIIALLGYTVHPRGQIWTPLTMLDVCIGLMCVVHALSDGLVDGVSVVLPIRVYGEWVLPYVAGRYAIADRTSPDEIARWVPAVLIVLGVASVVEAVTRVNPFELVFGERPLEGFPRTASRLGYKRAYGTVLHPIFYGMLMLILLPWLSVLMTRERTARERSLSIIALVVTAAGITGTVSRIPWLGMLAGSAILMAFCYRWLRWPVALSAAGSILCLVLLPNETADALSRWTGGGDTKSPVAIDGKLVEYTSTRSRLLIVPAYRDALRTARVTGYGTALTTGFPPRIPYLQTDTNSAQRLKNVDNAYVLLTLRFGWLGLAALTALLATGLGTAISLYRDRPDQKILASLTALLMVVLPALTMTWMSYDFGFELLWTLGVLSGLSSARLGARAAWRLRT